MPQPMAEIEPITKPFLPSVERGYEMFPSYSLWVSSCQGNGSRRDGCHAQSWTAMNVCILFSFWREQSRITWDPSVAGGRATWWQEPWLLEGYLEESHPSINKCVGVITWAENELLLCYTDQLSAFSVTAARLPSYVPSLLLSLRHWSGSLHFLPMSGPGDTALIGCFQQIPCILH